MGCPGMGPLRRPAQGGVATGMMPALARNQAIGPACLWIYIWTRLKALERCYLGGVSPLDRLDGGAVYLAGEDGRACRSLERVDVATGYLGHWPSWPLAILATWRGLKVQTLEVRGRLHA